MQDIALNQTSDGTWDIDIQNGVITMEDNHLSFAKHNLLCFGRGDKNLISNPLKRQGTINSYIEGRECFSTAWLNYIEANLISFNVNKIIQVFNNACNRDKNLGLIEKNISITEIIKLDKNTLSIKLLISNIANKTIIINL